MSTLEMREIQEVLEKVTRWTHARKFWLVMAIEWKHITQERALELHAISAEELARWQELYELKGSAGLMNKNIQEARADIGAVVRRIA